MDRTWILQGVPRAGETVSTGLYFLTQNIDFYFAMSFFLRIFAP
jgi:hypothetical protein